MKVYFWDQAARDFRKKFNSYEKTPTVLLVTAVNAQTLGEGSKRTCDSDEIEEAKRFKRGN
ncbi:hypothetical protein YC2023_042170 [Brassica napus]